MTDFIVRRSIRETLVNPEVGRFVINRAIREALVGATVGNFVVNRCVRETLLGTIAGPGTTAAPKRAAQIIG